MNDLIAEISVLAFVCVRVCVSVCVSVCLCACFALQSVSIGKSNS